MEILKDNLKLDGYGGGDCGEGYAEACCKGSKFPFGCGEGYEDGTGYGDGDGNGDGDSYMVGNGNLTLV